jgi:triacylglycerol esterase/lipase EstA (alpha/beta hydrolase family)
MFLSLAIPAMLLTIAAILTAVVVLVSFGIARQVRAESVPEMAGKATPMLPCGLMLREFLCLLFTLLLRPFGWPPPRPVPGEAARPPVLLLHGLFQNRSCLLKLQWHLHRAGYRTMSINTPPWHNLDTLTTRVAAGVERLCSTTGTGRVHLVGHSMGGILARNYLYTHGTEKVAGCVTLGTPHTGSQLAVFAVSSLGRSLLPGSPMLERLNAVPLPVGTRLTAIYSDDDNIIVPATNARLQGAENLAISGMGHTAMLFSRQVAEAVVTALGRDPQGEGQGEMTP